MAPHLAISEHRVGDVAVLSLIGWLVADDQDEQFRDRVDALVREGITKIVVDLHGVTLLDSGGVGVLVAKLITLRRRGGDLRLARMSDRAQRVLSVTQLLTVFVAFDSLDDAVRSFAANALPPQGAEQPT